MVWTKLLKCGGTKVEALIFSKNRPMQLDLCLRSHLRFWGENITVLYTTDELRYQTGYERLMLKYPQVKFENETNFKKQVVDYVKRNKYSVFFCDDDVMIRPFDKLLEIFVKSVLKIDDIACVSMRMAPNYNYHWETDSVVEIPEFASNTWNWQEADFDWGFPMSVLGHIFRREDILPPCENLFYNNPNQFESCLAQNPLHRKLMFCFDTAKNINIPANLVQTEVPNRAGTVSIKELNDKYMNGEVIDLNDVIQKTKDTHSCFILIDYKFIKEKK